MSVEAIEQEIADLGLAGEVAAELEAFEAGGGIAGLVHAMLSGASPLRPMPWNLAPCYWGNGFLVHVKPSCRCR
jgi:hypothetical protein